MKKIFRILIRVVVGFFLFSVLSTVILRFVNLPFTPLMIIRTCEQWDEGRDLKIDRKFAALGEMSPAIRLAVIAAEDQKFSEHAGFDLEAIKKAGKYNERHKGKRMRGASTISQQTAKNVFLWPSRSWIRKGVEVYFTFLIETLWSKDRIMEVYLNVAEWGDGIYGVEAASVHYFHKSCASLSVKEASLLAAVLPNPRKWSPVKPGTQIKRKAQRIVRFMGRLERADYNR